MKQNKGFTLIELLAVIVILAIIALIATPIILNVINDARKSAAKDSAYGFFDAAEKYIVIAAMGDDVATGYDQTKLPAATDTSCSTGSSSCNGFVDAVLTTVKGTKPTSVSLSVSNGAIQEGSYVTITSGGNNYTFVLQADGTLELS